MQVTHHLKVHVEGILLLNDYNSKQHGAHEAVMSCTLAH